MDEVENGQAVQIQIQVQPQTTIIGDIGRFFMLVWRNHTLNECEVKVAFISSSATVRVVLGQVLSIATYVESNPDRGDSL